MVFEEKFIAFVDILGFTKMVEAAEQEESGNFSRLVRLTEILGSKKEVQDLIEYDSNNFPG
jgi:predicted RNA-binding protein